MSRAREWLIRQQGNEIARLRAENARLRKERDGLATMIDVAGEVLRSVHDELERAAADIAAHM